MHADFWHERWTNNQIGFHEVEVNPLLVSHFPALQAAPASRILLPLCGKTLDIDWLLARGHRIVGAELSSLAAAALFERLGLTPEVFAQGALQRWHAGRLEVFVGDFLALDRAQLGPVDAIYDRAALIALPPGMRRRYAAHLDHLAAAAPQLLVTLDYDQSCIDGPPFSVDETQVRTLYPARAARRLASHPVPGGLKGRCPATEDVWLLEAAFQPPSG